MTPECRRYRDERDLLRVRVAELEADLEAVVPALQASLAAVEAERDQLALRVTELAKAEDKLTRAYRALWLSRTEPDAHPAAHAARTEETP